MAFNLTRAAGVIASTAHPRARTATIRAQLINVPARVANHGRKWRLHLPTVWPWQTASENLFPPHSPDEKPLTAREGTPVERPGRLAGPACPKPEITDSIQISSPGNRHRHIQAQPAWPFPCPQ